MVHTRPRIHHWHLGICSTVKKQKYKICLTDSYNYFIFSICFIGSTLYTQ